MLQPHSFNTQHISHIFGSLYLGSQYATRDTTLSERRIARIVSIGCKPLNRHVQATVFPFEVDDTGTSENVAFFFSDLVPKMHALLDEANEQGVPILVHCQAGMSRSAAVVITWLMTRQHMDFETAYAHVKARRPAISPNAGFMECMRTGRHAHV